MVAMRLSVLSRQYQTCETGLPHPDTLETTVHSWPWLHPVRRHETHEKEQKSNNVEAKSGLLDLVLPFSHSGEMMMRFRLKWHENPVSLPAFRHVSCRFSVIKWVRAGVRNFIKYYKVKENGIYIISIFCHQISNWMIYNTMLVYLIYMSMISKFMYCVVMWVLWLILHHEDCCCIMWPGEQAALFGLSPTQQSRSAQVRECVPGWVHVGK